MSKIRQLPNELPVNARRPHAAPKSSIELQEGPKEPLIWVSGGVRRN